MSRHQAASPRFLNIACSANHAETAYAAFTGQGVFVLGSVLEQFFAKYVSLNSFTETVVTTQQRKELIRWPMQTGKRPLL